MGHNVYRIGTGFQDKRKHFTNGKEFSLMETNKIMKYKISHDPVRAIINKNKEKFYMGSPHNDMKRSGNDLSLNYGNTIFPDLSSENGKSLIFPKMVTKSSNSNNMQK